MVLAPTDSQLQLQILTRKRSIDTYKSSHRAIAERIFNNSSNNNNNNDDTSNVNFDKQQPLFRGTSKYDELDSIKKSDRNPL